MGIMVVWVMQDSHHQPYGTAKSSLMLRQVLEAARATPGKEPGIQEANLNDCVLVKA